VGAGPRGPPRKTRRDPGPVHRETRCSPGGAHRSEGVARILRSRQARLATSGGVGAPEGGGRARKFFQDRPVLRPCCGFASPGTRFDPWSAFLLFAKPLSSRDDGASFFSPFAAGRRPAPSWGRAPGALDESQSEFIRPGAGPGRALAKKGSSRQTGCRSHKLGGTREDRGWSPGVKLNIDV